MIKRWLISTLASLHYFGNPSSNLNIVGITGTNGKTTTATLLYKIATELGYKSGLISTVENIIVNEKRDTINTTPGPIVLNKLFKEMVEKGCEYVFMEVSSHALDQKRVAGIDFVGGIFTNLTHDHLDYHKSFENYFLAKKKFFQMLSSDAFALSNRDDQYGEKIIKDIKAKKYLYGFNVGAELLKGSSAPTEYFQGEIKKIDFNGLELLFNNEAYLPAGRQVKSKLLGKFNAYNLLAVWSTCKLLGFDMEKVAKILEDIKPPTGRFDHFISESGVLGIVDYAHSPDSLKNVLLTINEIKNSESKVICLFGCGGDRDPLKRRIMGKIGAELSDVPIFTSDNPRSEDPDKIISEMKTDLSVSESQKIKIISNRKDAIIESTKIAKSGDIILLAGKGHEDYQEIKGVKHHFNDMEELKNNLK